MDTEERGLDAVVEAYKRDIDRTLLRENLRKTVEERVRALMALQRFAVAARAAGRAARERA
ncbi:MAG: hypothetical protein ABI442_20285 [Gemmatimonadaceae bacterium]